MVKMKLFLWSIVASIAAFGSESTQLLQVHSVYILPMGSAMDQFIANRLTRFGRIQVVTDPQRADAILTDRLGEPFEKKLDELYGPTQVKEVQDEKDTDEEATGIVLKDEQQPNRLGSFSRGRGNFFLVDRKTRNIVWSTYEHPKNSSADELNRTAEHVVNSLKRDLKPAQPTQ